MIQRTIDLITPDAFLSSDYKGFELVDGQLVEKLRMGPRASGIAAEIVGIVRDWNRQYKLGYVFDSEGGYQCFPQDRQRVRKPDVSFTAGKKIPAGVREDQWIQVPPDFVVEVVSYREYFVKVQAKITEYLTAGVRWIWIVNPTRQEVHVYDDQGTTSILKGNDMLRNEDVLPGFSTTVEKLFPEHLTF
jgi:Uma2 family endonuclease